MSNDNYENQVFKHSYPYTWEKHNKVYLKKYENRPQIKEYIVPLVFRIRFYDLSDTIISDKFYTSKSNIEFPNVQGIEYWCFTYDDELVYVNADNRTALETAIDNGYEDIRLNASLI